MSKMRTAARVCAALLATGVWSTSASAKIPIPIFYGSEGAILLTIVIIAAIVVLVVLSRR